MDDFEFLQHISDDMLKIRADTGFHDPAPAIITKMETLLAQAYPLSVLLLGGDDYHVLGLKEIERRRKAGIPIAAYEWVYEISSEVESVVAAVKMKLARAKRKPVAAQKDPAAPEKPKFIDEETLDDLRSLPNTKYDFRRLVRLCEELNVANENNCYFSMAMLIRAIIDHIPPVFGVTGFAEVGAQHGSKSFKGSMKHLLGSLKNIADGYLHGQITKNVTLATAGQVHFSQDIHVLLAEVVRVSK